MLKFYVKVFKISKFLNPCMNLFYIWHDYRYWSKILFRKIPAPAYDLAVKVTDLEIYVKVLRHFFFFFFFFFFLSFLNFYILAWIYLIIGMIIRHLPHPCLRPRGQGPD